MFIVRFLKPNINLIPLYVYAFSQFGFILIARSYIIIASYDCPNVYSAFPKKLFNLKPLV